MACLLHTHEVSFGDRIQVPWVVDFVSKPDAFGTQVIRVRQRYANALDVLGGELVVSALKGRPIALSGRLLRPGAVAGSERKVSGEEEVLAAAGRVLMEPVELARRYFDPSCLCAVSELRGLGSHTIYRWLEAEGVVNDQWSGRYGLNMVGKTTVAKSYDGFRELGDQTVPVAVDWTQNGPSGQSKACLDWQAYLANGQPRIVMELSQTRNVTEAHCELVPQGSRHIAPGHPGKMNAYFWLNDLATFSRDNGTAYSSVRAFDDARPLYVYVPDTNPCPPGSSACAGTSHTHHTIWLPAQTGSPFDLRTIAHEQGHIIHLSYAQLGSGFQTSALREGFADHNVLRYMLYRARAPSRPHDSVSYVGYFDSFGLEAMTTESSKVSTREKRSPSLATPMTIRAR